MSNVSGLLPTVSPFDLSNKCCIVIIKRFLQIDGVLKQFRIALERQDANELKRLIEVDKFDVNAKITFEDGHDVYAATPMTTAIIYSAFKNKDVSCVQVQQAMMRMQTWSVHRLSDASIYLHIQGEP